MSKRPIEAEGFVPRVEAEKKETEQSKNLEYSAELIKNPPRPGWPGHDRIFITGRVSFKDGLWQVDIAAGDPTAALDQSANEEFGLNSPLVSDLRKDRESGLTLISAGSFMWLNEGGQSRLVLLKRSEDAKADPGYLTGPAGRCGEKPSETIAAETREELTIAEEILPSGNNHFTLAVFYQDKETLNEAISTKLCQLENRYRDLRQKYDQAKRRQPGQEAELDRSLKILRQIRGEDDVTPVDLKDCPKTGDGLDNVITRVEGKQIDSIKNCLAYLDEKNNTLEIRKAFEYRLPENSRLALVIDGENFNREVMMIDSLEKLKGQKNLVPALDNYARKNPGQSPFSEN